MPRSLLIAGLFVFSASGVLAGEGPQRGRSDRNPDTTDSLVEIETTGGRKLVGHLEPDSDTRAVYLRSEQPGIVLRSRVPGSTIRRIGRYDGSQVLRLDRSTQRQPGISRPVDVEAPSTLSMQSVSATHRRVQTLRIEAWPENRDSDAEHDGLRLVVTPLSTQGVPVAVRGTLSLKLIARRFSGVRIDDTVGVVEEWSRQLTTDDFGPNGAVIDLPFRKFDPERDLDVIPVGLLQARLGISGQGCFDAPPVEIWLRPTSYIRDELQFHTGQRLLFR
jgi:hypothetical protein